MYDQKLADVKEGGEKILINRTEIIRFLANHGADCNLELAAPQIGRKLFLSTTLLFYMFAERVGEIYENSFRYNRVNPGLSKINFQIAHQR